MYGLQFPIFEDFKQLKDLEFVIGVLFFGSTIYEGKTPKDSDLDCLIILSDDFSQSQEKLLLNVLESIKKSLASKQVKLHLQPPMTLNVFIRRVITLEPWIVSSLSHGFIYKDSSGVLKALKSIVANKKTRLKTEHIDLLLTRAYDNIVKTRKSLLNMITLLTDLYLLITRLIASRDGFIIPDPESAIKYLKNLPEFESFKQEFEDLSLINKKFEAGTLGEFKGVELDEWLARCENYFLTVQKTILKVEKSWL